MQLLPSLTMRHCSLSARTREAAKSHCPRSWDEDRLLGNHFAPVRGLCLQVSVGKQVKKSKHVGKQFRFDQFPALSSTVSSLSPSVRIGSYAILHPRSRDNSRQISHGLFDHLSVRSFHRTDHRRYHRGRIEMVKSHSNRGVLLTSNLPQIQNLIKVSLSGTACYDPFS